MIEYKIRWCKNCFQKVVHNAGEFLGNKIPDEVSQTMI